MSTTAEPVTDKEPWPAAMRQVTAARYLDLSPRTFRRVCPVAPVCIEGAGQTPVRRWRRVDLDRWLARLLGQKP